MLCLTEMSVKCENSLISHEWYFRESEWKKVERVKEQKEGVLFGKKKVG